MNYLSNETSEYLIQHSNNPVNWYPWGEEAFEKAQKEDKPIFLSIGYSSCHWCHVMEKESFEDLETAEILNKNFVSIKVDREERPDIDSVYMAAIQMINGNGGWPASIFMNNKGIPFYAGTYFPKFDRNNMPAFKSVLAKIIEIYHNDRSSIDNHSQVVMDGLDKFFNSSQVYDATTDNIFETIVEQIKKTFDFEKGGFGEFPKFPETSKLQIIYLLGKKYSTNNWFDMGQLSLGSMINGGIYDQLAGGFARYSTDREWKVPHFEKMLYDNALILSIMCTSYKVTKNKNIFEAIIKTFEFLNNEIKNKENLFYSTQDADSEGEEGTYYLWSYEELEKILSSDEFKIIKTHWDISEEGDLDGKNILNINKSPQDISNEQNIAYNDVTQTIDKVKKDLLEIREKRIKPNTDEKIITSWNSLLITSFCNMYNISNDDKFLDQAKKTADSVLKFCVKNDQLMHTSEGQNSFLEDYSYFVNSLFEIYNSSLDPYWYNLAKEFSIETISKFWSSEEKLFFDSLEDTDLIIRPKGFFDPMVPNPAAIASQNIYKLYRFTGDEKYFEIVGDSIKKVSGFLNKSPLDVPSWFNLYFQMQEQSYEIVVSGNKKDDFYYDAKSKILSSYIPNLIFCSTNGENTDLNLPVMEGRKNDEQTKIYICKNYICDLPITNMSELNSQLKGIVGIYK